MRKLIIRNQLYFEEHSPKTFDIPFKKFYIEPPTKEDLIERNYLLSLLEKYCTLFFDNDINSRRVALQPKYDNDEILASCMSFIQFLIRENCVYCYCTMRSELNTTHNWDCDTLVLLTEYVKNRYNIPNEKIVMTVNSYHYKAED